jgi:hypothetical protein
MSRRGRHHGTESSRLQGRHYAPALSRGIEPPFHERHTAQAQMEVVVAGIPMGRAGSPEECVGAVRRRCGEVARRWATSPSGGVPADVSRTTLRTH